MTVDTMISNIVLLSDRDDLDDEKPLLLYWLNQIKLQLARDRTWRMFKDTTLIVLQDGQRNTDLPSNFLAPLSLRRLQLDKQVTDPNLGNVVQRQRFRKYLDKDAFEAEFPELDTNGNIVKGTPNNYIIHGTKIRVAPTPNKDETLFFDHKVVLPDYDTVVVTEDEVSRIAYDVLIRGTLEEIFDSWVLDEVKARKWERKKNIAITSVNKTETSGDASMSIDDLQIETFDGNLTIRG